jgi:hypothetical protein
MHVHERFPPVSSEAKQCALSYDVPLWDAKENRQKEPLTVRESAAKERLFSHQ